jgi:hypothetical protein
MLVAASLTPAWQLKICATGMPQQQCSQHALLGISACNVCPTLQGSLQLKLNVRIAKSGAGEFNMTKQVFSKFLILRSSSFSTRVAVAIAGIVK